MSKENKVIAEAMAIRYMDLAGLGQIQEEIDVEKIYEPVEDAVGGGENLVHPIDHTDVVAEEGNVQGVEIADPVTGEVDISTSEIERIAEAVKAKIRKESSS